MLQGKEGKIERLLRRWRYLAAPLSLSSLQFHITAGWTNKGKLQEQHDDSQGHELADWAIRLVKLLVAEDRRMVASLAL